MTLFKGHRRIEKIIVSLSLSNLFSPNSNSFPMNSNIAATATVLRVMVVVPLLNSSIPILVLRCLDLDF